MKEDLGPAAEGFDITGVFGNKSNDFSGNTIFAAKIRKRSNHTLKINIKEQNTGVLLISSQYALSFKMQARRYRFKAGKH